MSDVCPQAPDGGDHHFVPKGGFQVCRYCGKSLAAVRRDTLVPKRPVKPRAWEFRTSQDQRVALRSTENGVMLTIEDGRSSVTALVDDPLVLQMIGWLRHAKQDNENRT